VKPVRKRRAARLRARFERTLREASNKLRARLPVRDAHRDAKRHRRMVQAYAGQREHIPGTPRYGW
jgi:hypothetical protein